METVPGTLLGNRFWEPYLQAVPKNLTLLGNLFLDTCLGASSWELAWERFSPTAKAWGLQPPPRTRFPIKFSSNRFASKVTRNDSQARFPRTGSQARFPSKGSRNSCQASQARFPGTGFEEKVAKKVSKNGFASKGVPGKVPGNRFPSKVRKTRFLTGFCFCSSDWTVKKPPNPAQSCSWESWDVFLELRRVGSWGSWEILWSW